MGILVEHEVIRCSGISAIQLKVQAYLEDYGTLSRMLAGGIFEY